jgi:hypothetical protein
MAAEDPSPEIESALDALTEVDEDLVGDDVLALELILALVDQAAVPPKVQVKVAKLLGPHFVEDGEDDDDDEDDDE